MDDERLVSLTEAAALCGLSSAQLRLLAKKGRLRAIKVGKSWVTTPRAVADHMADVKKRSKDPTRYRS